LCFLFAECDIYLGEKKTVGLLLEEGADLHKKSAAADVLEVGTVLHFGDVGACTFAEDSWAAFLGKFVSLFVIEWASSRCLKYIFCNDY
jgi:hypothetical protein